MVADNPGALFFRINRPRWSLATALTRFKAQVRNLPCYGWPLQSSEPPNDATEIDRGRHHRDRRPSPCRQTQLSTVSSGVSLMTVSRGCVPLCIFNQVDGGLSQKLPIALNIQIRGN